MNTKSVAGILLGGLVLIGLVLLLARVIPDWFGRGPDRPELETQPDTVPDSAVVAARPRPPRGLGRLTQHTVKPRAQVSRGTPDTVSVQNWLRAVRLADSLRRENARLRERIARGDSTLTQGDTIRQLPQTLAPGWGVYDGKKLRLGLTRSDGSVMIATAKLRPKFTWQAGLDSLTDSVPLFVEDRWWLRTGREALQCVPRAAPMAGAGALADRQDRFRGALIGAGAAWLGCMLD